MVDKAGTILSLVWFHLSDLVQYLDKKYGANRAGIEMEDSWIDLEPSGQLCLKMYFGIYAIYNFKEQTKRIVGSDNQLFRREAVQKVYPKNGHQFVAQQFYQVMKCAVCSEFLGRSCYQCQSNIMVSHKLGCNYLIHARCYNRVVTKCVDCRSPQYKSVIILILIVVVTKRRTEHGSTFKV